MRTRGGSGQYIATVVTVVNRKDLNDEPYTTTWSDMVRIVDGETDEHWHPMIKL